MLAKILILLAVPLQSFACFKVFIHAEHCHNINLVPAERTWEQAELCVFASICISTELFKKIKMQMNEYSVLD